MTHLGLEVTTDSALSLIVTCLISATVLAWIGWGGSTGRLRPNPIAGIRIGQSTPGQWRASHRAATPWIIASVVAAVLGAGLAGLCLWQDWYAPVLPYWLAMSGEILALLALIPAVYAANRAMVQTRREEERAHRSHRSF